MPAPEQKSIDAILNDFQIILSGETVPVFGELNAELHKAIDAQCKREFSSENWQFLQQIKELNEASHIDQEILVSLFKKYIQAGSELELNIKSEARSRLQDKFFRYEETYEPLSLSDFAAAAEEISKLMMKDTFRRIESDPNFIKAHNSDLVEISNMNNKLAMQLDAVEIFKDLNKYTMINLEEIHIDKPILRWGRKPFEEAPFKTSQHIIDIMKDQLNTLLEQSDKSSFAEFKQSFDNIINSNLKILSQYSAIIEKQIKKLPDSDTDKVAYQQQLNKFNNVIAASKLKFNWTPEELSNAKKVGVSNIIKSFTSQPLVEQMRDFSDTEVQTRSRSISLSRRSE